MTAPVGNQASCTACGRRGKRRQSLPDDPGVIARLGLPRALACSAECMRRIMAGGLTLPPGFGLGWIK